MRPRWPVLALASVLAAVLAACGASPSEPAPRIVEEPAAPVASRPEPEPEPAPPPLAARHRPPELQIAQSFGERVFVMGEEGRWIPRSHEGASRIDGPAPIYVHPREGVVREEPYHLFAADGSRCEGTNPRAVLLHQTAGRAERLQHAIEVDASCAAVVSVRADAELLASARFVSAAESVTVSRASRRACPELEASNGRGGRVRLRPSWEHTPLGVLEIGDQRALLTDGILRNAYDLGWSRAGGIIGVIRFGHTVPRRRCRPAERRWLREPSDLSPDVFAVDRFSDRAFVILSNRPLPGPVVEPERVDRGAQLIGVRALDGAVWTPPAPTLVALDGTQCSGTNPRWVRIDRYIDHGDQADPDHAATFLALEVDATCDGQLAVFAEASEVIEYTPVTWADVAGEAVRTGDLGGGFSFERHRGRPIDEICHEAPTTVIRYGGAEQLRFTRMQNNPIGRLRVGDRALLLSEYHDLVDLSWSPPPQIVSNSTTPTDIGDGDDRCW